MYCCNSKRFTKQNKRTIMSAIPDIYDKHTMNTLNAYFHLIAACNYLDLPISDRKIFTNQAFMKQMISTRKEARIFITEIQKAYQASGIDMKSIEKESEVVYNAMEIMEKMTDKLDIKPIIKVKF